MGEALEALAVWPLSVYFRAEPDLDRTIQGWRVVCHSNWAEPFVMGRGFLEEAAARAWAGWLNDMAERSFPHPAVREAAEAWPESDEPF